MGGSCDSCSGCQNWERCNCGRCESIGSTVGAKTEQGANVIDGDDNYNSGINEINESSILMSLNKIENEIQYIFYILIIMLIIWIFINVLKYIKAKTRSSTKQPFHIECNDLDDLESENEKNQLIKS